MLISGYWKEFLSLIDTFSQKDKNKWHGNNSHAKYTIEEAASRRAKYRKARNKKRKMLKFRRRG